LRAVIQEANATLEKDVIFFVIPQSSGDPNCTAATHVCTIFPASARPPITSPLTINSYSQPGSSPNTLAVGNDAVLNVQLDGSNIPGGTIPVDGLRSFGSSENVIRGLVINGFSGDGIVVSGDTSSGATVANNNRIEGNFVGTDPSGEQDLGNIGCGITCGALRIASGAFSTTVGGTSTAARNVISGNNTNGILLGPGSASTRVQGNYIGTDRDGEADLGNSQSGIRIASTQQYCRGHRLRGWQRHLRQ
jgi:hypothetical protein